MTWTTLARGPSNKIRPAGATDISCITLKLLNNCASDVQEYKREDQTFWSRTRNFKMEFLEPNTILIESYNPTH